MQSEQYFSRKQRALFVSSENLGWPWPPGSYAPVRIENTDMIGNRENLYIDAIIPMQILMVELITFESFIYNMVCFLSQYIKYMEHINCRNIFFYIKTIIVFMFLNKTFNININLKNINYT
jgi:hypothetical protein